MAVVADEGFIALLHTFLTKCMLLAAFGNLQYFAYLCTINRCYNFYGLLKVCNSLDVRFLIGGGNYCLKYAAVFVFTMNIIKHHLYRLLT